MAWIYFNPNPVGRNVGDCSVRAIAKAIGTDWEKAFVLLAANAYSMGDMPSSNSVISSVMRKNGFYRSIIPDSCPDCYTAEDFCQDNPHGTYVLGFGSHVAAVKDGDLYDSWDSSKEIPQYFWYRKE